MIYSVSNQILKFLPEYITKINSIIKNLYYIYDFCSAITFKRIKITYCQILLNNSN